MCHLHMPIEEKPLLEVVQARLTRPMTSHHLQETQFLTGSLKIQHKHIENSYLSADCTHLFKKTKYMKQGKFD